MEGVTWLLYMFNGVAFGLMSWEQSLLNWFQGQNLLGDDQHFKKEWGSQKGGESNIKEESLFLFYQSKLLSHFVPVSSDTILKERSLG